MRRRKAMPAGRVLLAVLAVLAALLGAVWVAPANAAAAYALKVSAAPDRSAPRSLAGGTLSGRVYVFLAPTTDVRRVAFYLDDPKRTHKARTVDTSAPFDLVGGTADAALPYATTALKDGKHTLTAVLTLTGGTSKVVSATFTAKNPVPAPKATAAKAGNGRVTITWASGGGVTTGFDIYRSTTRTIRYTKPLNAKLLPRTASSYVDRTVKNGKRYYYVVRAISPKHHATSGAKVSARPLVPPKVPTEVSTLSGDGTVEVSWHDAGGTVQGWRIYRGPTSGVSLTTPLATLKAAAHSFTDKGLTNGQTRYYVVQAYADAFTAHSSAVPGTPIPAPSGVTTAPNDKSVTVSWTVPAGADAITGFRVYVGATSTVSITGTPAASTSHADARSLPVTKDGAGHPLVNGQTYYFRVVSVSAGGKAPASAVSAVPVPAVTLTATASSGQVLLAWNSTGPDTTEYQVFRGNGSAVPPSGASNTPLAEITDGSTSYVDLSVGANTTYTYVVVAVASTWRSASPARSAKTPAVNNGPVPSGWGGSLVPTNLDWPSGAIKSALGTQLTDYRYVFNRIGTTNVDKTDTLHVKPCADMRLTNTGGGPVTINSMSVSGPYELVYSNLEDGCPGGTAVSFPYSLGSGSSITVEVRFDYCRGNTPATTCDASNLPAKGVQYGQLTINSNDPGHTVATATLAGAWQQTAGGADELPLQSFINQALGITTHLTGGYDANGVYKGINYGNGLVVAVGDEVLSPYWQASDGSVSVRQVVATHTQGGHEPLFWYPQGSPGSATNFLSQAGTDYQTLLPGGSNGPRAEGSFSPGGQTFGFRTNSGSTADWSDDTLNTGTMANDYRHGCPTSGPCGHHIRFYPLRNASGAIVANTYLMCVDSQGVNLDFNDEDYIISGITPAPSN